MDHRAQGAFEYILMLSGVLLIVVLIVFILQGTVSSANETLGDQSSEISSLVDATKYTPGANMEFLQGTTKNGAAAREAVISAGIVEKDAALNGLTFSWNATNVSIYDSSLVLMMNFDNVAQLGENTATVKGSSIYRNNGTNNGATWVADGRYGGTYYFDGNDNIAAPINYRLSTTRGPSTIEAWIRPNNTAASVTIISDNCLEWGFTLSGGNVNGYVFTPVSGGPVSPNQWYHIALVHEHPTGLTNTLIKIYVNGELKNTATRTVSSDDAYTDSNFWIGQDGCYSNPGFNGSIDEVRIWNRALSSDEVRLHYATNIAKFGPGLWKFDAKVSVPSGQNTYQISTISNQLHRKYTERRTVNSCTLPYPLC